MVKKYIKITLKKSSFINISYFVVILFNATSTFSQSSSDFNQKAVGLRKVLQPFFIPVEKNVNFLESNEKKINLGKHLFYDERLSPNSKISCYSCHNLNKYGTNGDYYVKNKGAGIFFRDVPSIYNVTTLPLYNADGGENSLKEKLHSTFSNSFEMNVKDTDLIVQRLKAIKGYVNLFNEAYPNTKNSISFNTIINALHTFIKGLITPSPIDDFIKGNNNALSKEQINGGHIFNNKNCYSCHTGSNIGGQMIQKLGIEVAWPNQKDLGYYRLKQLSDYKMFFRVAPLRNVVETPPYFHDASSNRLWQAIKLMGKHERGLEISTKEALKINEFLKSLTGKIPLEYIKKPTKLN